jgi:hypothetical protein
MQAWKAMIEKSAKKNQEKLLNNDLQRHVIDTNRQVQELSARQQQSSVSVSVNTQQANPLEGGMQVNFFDKAPSAAPAAIGSAGQTLAAAPTGLAPVAGSKPAQATAPQPAEPQAVEERQMARDERKASVAAETVVTRQDTTNREVVVDDQIDSVQGGVSQTQFQNDGDDRVSIKEQDRTFESKSAYTSNFGDNAGAKNAVTSATGAESGYSGGEEQSNQGQRQQQ